MQRYIRDPVLIKKLKEEAEDFATISVIYGSQVSSLHMTEPKYTRQDMLTIISGNIEAWIGLSAVHIYLFCERLYDALLEAELIPAARRPGRRLVNLAFGRKRARADTGGSDAGGRAGAKFKAKRAIAGLFLLLISILTKLKVKISQLFTYVAQPCAILLGRPSKH